MKCIAMSPATLINQAMQDHYHRYSCWPQRVVLHLTVFRAFFDEVEPMLTYRKGDTKFVREDGAIVFNGVPVVPTSRTVPPYLVNYQGIPEDL